MDNISKDEAEKNRKAAEQGDAEAQCNLGKMYYNGQGVRKNDAEALKWWRKAAEQGNAEAQADLGMMYYNGDGVPVDAAEAAKWFREAAEQRHAGAQGTLGLMYAKGDGVPQDAAEAVKRYRKAAEQGHVLSQCSLGAIYFSGKGVPEDAAEALKWYRKAAEQGYVVAQFSLGAIYFSGKGVPEDYAEAVKWLRKAAEQGLDKAQYSLGVMYANGKGVPQDDAEAAKWYRKAAEQGHRDAQGALDMMYEGGTVGMDNISKEKVGHLTKSTFGQKKRMPSLEEQCIETVYCFLQPGLEDNHWQAFGFKKCPRRGEWFNIFVSSKKLELEKVLLSELLAAGVGQVFVWAGSQPHFALRTRFLARLLEIFVDVFGYHVWSSFGFKERDDIVAHMLSSGNDYASAEPKDYPKVFLSRIQSRLTQKVPNQWLIGTVRIFINSSSFFVIPRALSASGIAQNTIDDLNLSTDEFVQPVAEIYS